MKSAEEYISVFSENVLGFLNGGADKSVSIIEQIQQEAYNSAIDDAAKTVRKNYADGKSFEDSQVAISALKKEV
jgi:hypothetical protein